MIMRFLPAVVALALAGCGSGGSSSNGTGDRSTDPSAEVAVASQLSFDFSSVRVGQWVLYTAKIAGERGTWSVKYACVDEDRDGVWIENKVPYNPRPMVIKSKVSRKGESLEQWVGESGSPQPAKTYPRPDRPPPKTDEGPRPNITAGQATEQIVAGGRTFTCTKVTSTQTHPDGRTSTLISWHSAEVPFDFKVGEVRYGGVVKRQWGRFTMELATMGTTAQPELTIPPR